MLTDLMRVSPLPKAPQWVGNLRIELSLILSQRNVLPLHQNPHLQFLFILSSIPKIHNRSFMTTFRPTSYNSYFSPSFTTVHLIYLHLSMNVGYQPIRLTTSLLFYNFSSACLWRIELHFSERQSGVITVILQTHIF